MMLKFIAKYKLVFLVVAALLYLNIWVMDRLLELVGEEAGDHNAN